MRNVRAVVHEAGFRALNPHAARRLLEALPEFTDSPAFRQLAVAFKRVRNIARELPGEDAGPAAPAGPAPEAEPAERALAEEIARRAPAIEGMLADGRDYRAPLAEAAAFGPAVDRFFTEVFVMAEDPAVRTARLRLMKRLEHLILKLADVSEIVPQTDA